MDNIRKQSSFFQSATNTMKNGAYYTDIGHCERIGYLFDFEKASEICILEPSAGNGEALLAVTGKEREGREHLRLFLVEIEKNVFNEKLQSNPLFNYTLNADFLNGVVISNSRFSFSFANWPYGTTEHEGKMVRLETRFLEKETPYLARDGYLATVIPKAALHDNGFQRRFIAMYEYCGAWRFDDSVYEQFHQVLLVGKKKGYSRYEKESLDAFAMAISDIESLPYLPKSKEEVEEKFVINESKDDSSLFFDRKVFEPKDYIDVLGNCQLYKDPKVVQSIFQKPYAGSKVLNPILPLDKDKAYILAVQGFGEGYTGSEENGDLHLNRGRVHIVKDAKVITGDKGKLIVSETTHSKVVQTIIEGNGKITKL